MKNIHDDVLKVLVTEEQIEQRAKELAKEIDNDYQDKKPVLLSLLRGSLAWTWELSKFMNIELEYDYMRASSYKGTESTGNVGISIMPQTQLKGRHVIIIEDIIDTGATLSTVVKILEKECQPESIEICTLLDKPYLRKVDDVVPKYIGFKIPNEFVIGFGLDYDEFYRNLPYVGVLKPEVYKK